LVFNRPDRARTVLDAIRKVQPAHLYISADGPRAGKSGEAALCAEARAIIREIDWACEIHTNFLDVNLGCANAVSQGINWFFTQVEQGIILEDDCLPNASFFWFCDKLLEHYKDDHRVMHISGNNFQDGQVRGDASYYFSRESLIWGWATWRRAWQHFDLSTASLADFEKQDGMSDLYQDLLIKKYKLYHLKKIQKMSKKTSWAFPWSYAVYTQGGLCVTPNVNLVSNIGFGTESVHAKKPMGSLFLHGNP